MPAVRARTPGHRGHRRLVVASFRSPYTIRLSAGRWASERTVGGLVSALEPVLRQRGGTWVAFRSGEPSELPEQLTVPPEDPAFRLRWVTLSKRQMSHFYHGFSNRVMWPLCHDFWERCSFRQDYWRDYLRANARMAQSLRKESAPGDWIWIHDYQLALVPHMLQKLLRQARIALFWHIAFHVPLWKNHFLETVSWYLPGAKVDAGGGRVLSEGRRTSIEAIPIGIDVESYQPRAEHLRRCAHLLVNPLNVEDVVHTLARALSMGPEEKAERMARLRERVLKHDVFWWTEQNLRLLSREARDPAALSSWRAGVD